MNSPSRCDGLSPVLEEQGTAVLANLLGIFALAVVTKATMTIASEILLGFGVGFLTGATGIGGGTIMAPALIFVLRMSPFVSVGTDLFVSAITKAVGALMHRRANTVYSEIAWPLSIAGVIGALAGAVALWLIKSHMNMTVAQSILRHGIGIALFVCAAFIALTLGDRWRRDIANVVPYAWIVGTVVAVITTITGVGVGSLSVPSLYLISGRRSMAVIVGTSLVFGMMVTIVGSLAHMALHDVDYMLSLWLLIGAVPGVALGSALAIRASAILRPIVALLLVVSGVRLVM